MRYKVGDNVIVNAGNDRGKTGVIAKLSQDKVLIEGVNAKTKHIKGREGMPGQKVEFNAPIHISNISPIDADTGKASRLAIAIEKDGSKTRITKASGKPFVKAAAKKEAPKKKAEPKAATKTKTIKAE